MSGNEYGQKTAGHECRRRNKRPDRPSRDATDTMAACATARVTRADANQKTSDEYFGPPGLDVRRYRVPEQIVTIRGIGYRLAGIA